MAVNFDSDHDWPTTATWWLTVSGINAGKAIWNRMDKEEHVGYVRDRPEGYEGDDKFSVFRGDGLKAHCDDCDGSSISHLIWPDDFLGHAATEHEAAMMVQEYAEDAADDVEWQGTPPIHRKSARHPRAKRFWV